jgi:hypothetical protein
LLQEGELEEEYENEEDEEKFDAIEKEKDLGMTPSDEEILDGISSATEEAMKKPVEELKDNDIMVDTQLEEDILPMMV